MDCLALRTVLLVSFVAGAAIYGCGSDGSPGKGPDGGEGASPGHGANAGRGANAGHGGSGENGPDASGGGATGFDAGSGGTSGAGNTSTDSGAPPPIVPGTIDSIWQRASAHLTAIDSAASPPSFADETVDLPPARASDEFGGQQVQSFQQIKDDTLVTYFFKEGDTVYYRATEPLTRVDTIYATGAAQPARVYELVKGQLVETFTYTLGTAIVANETTFTAYTGSFPPKSWPTKAIDIP